jgi:hypothetical protein
VAKIMVSDLSGRKGSTKWSKKFHLKKKFLNLDFHIQVGNGILNGSGEIIKL